MRKLFGPTKQQRTAVMRTDLSTNLLRYAAKVGGQVFGPIPKNIRREFFCLDEHTWLWHEEITDGKGKVHTVSTRYEVRDSEVVKYQGANVPKPLSLQEARNLYRAIELYEDKVENELRRLAELA